MAVNPALAGLVAAVVTAALTPLVIQLARRTDVMDHPGPLKPHAAPVPYLGGVAVFGGTVAGLIGAPHPVVLLPLLGALLLGLVDDITSLGVLPRFSAELAIGVGVAWSVEPDDWLLAGALVIGTVVMINAVNFVDGIDGLATGVSAVSLVGFAVVLPDGWARTAAAGAGAGVGFLLFNRPPARIYLGDAGSYLLGTSLAVAAGAYLSSGGTGTTPGVGGIAGTGVGLAAVVAAIGLMAYPVVEFVSTVGRRLVSRRPLFAGDRDHAYDQLVQRGLGGPATAAALISAHLLLVVAAVATDARDDALLTVVVLALLLATIVIAAVPRPGPSARSSREA